MTQEEFDLLPSGFKFRGFMKVDISYYSDYNSCVVDLETGKIVHWSVAWYK